MSDLRPARNIFAIFLPDTTAFIEDPSAVAVCRRSRWMKRGMFLASIFVFISNASWTGESAMATVCAAAGMDRH
jgi:hypothetical protein